MHGRVLNFKHAWVCLHVWLNAYCIWQPPILQTLLALALAGDAGSSRSCRRMTNVNQCRCCCHSAPQSPCLTSQLQLILGGWSEAPLPPFRWPTGLLCQILRNLSCLPNPRPMASVTRGVAAVLSGCTPAAAAATAAGAPLLLPLMLPPPPLLLGALDATGGLQESSNARGTKMIG